MENNRRRLALTVDFEGELRIDGFEEIFGWALRKHFERRLAGESRK
jgi:hypothetical protein